MGGGQEEGAIEHKAYARVGLLGNPSDVYFGRTISLSLGNFWASVRLEPSEDLVFRPHPTHDLVSFTSIHHLVSRLQSEGYYGGVPLLMAICKVFCKHCTNNNIKLKEGNFTLSYDTNIPRQVKFRANTIYVCKTDFEYRLELMSFICSVDISIGAICQVILKPVLTML